MAELDALNVQRAVILTTLPGEYKAIREHLENLEEEVYEGTVYEKGRFLAGGGKKWEIAIAQIGPGNIAVAVETERSLEHFDPNVILFVGLAGGIRDVGLGDVVVANDVYCYELSRDSLEEQSSRKRPEVLHSSYHLVQVARSLANRKNWLKRVHGRPSLPNPSPRVFVGPILTVDQVIRHISELDRYSIPSSFRKPLAVEMEGRGFLQAALEYKRAETLIIRGVADLIEQKSEAADYRLIAARLASAFAFELLANIEAVSSTSTDESSTGSVGNAVQTANASEQQVSITPSSQQEDSFPLPDLSAQANLSSSTPPSVPVTLPAENNSSSTINLPGATPAPDPTATSAPTNGQIAASAGTSSSAQPDSAVAIADPADSSSTLSTPPSAAAQPPQVVMKDGLDPEDVEKSARNDKPVERIEDDRLGYKLYAQALRDFITSKDTTTPLTISINGPWGSGKSSLMKMLQSQLEPLDKKMWTFLWHSFTWRLRYWGTFPVWLWCRLLLWVGSDEIKKNINVGLAYKAKDPERPEIDQLPMSQRYWAQIAVKKQPRPAPFQPTVWFNAWKFSQEEQIWAAMATEVLNQLQAKYPWPLRLLFWLKLTRRRAKIGVALRQIILNLLPALGLLALAIYSLYLLPFLRNALPQPAIPAIYGGSALLWLGTLWGLVKASVKAANVNPFKISLKEVLDPPNYEEKIGFIGRFEEDFAHIVAVTTQLASKAWESQKLVIFIDDIDRCRLPQTVNIIEAISLFLDSAQCVFIIGMDPAAIVTSIESKYRDLVNKIRRTTPGIVSPGSLFLDKIIQISFNLPRAPKRCIDDLIEEIMHAQDRVASRTVPITGPGQLGVNGSSQAAPDPTGSVPPPGSAPAVEITQTGNVTTTPSMDASDINFEWDDIYTAIKCASAHLKENPRQIKRFINLFLLKVYIANRLDMLSGQSLEPLAVLVVWSMQWPEVIRLLLNDTRQVEMCDYLADICRYITAASRRKMHTTSQISEEGQELPISEYNRMLTALRVRRKDERSSPSHWSHLPWEEWFRDPDFLACLKCMDTERLWEQIKTEQEGVQPQNRLNLPKLMRL